MNAPTELAVAPQASLLARLGDRANPILVKEVRQSLRGKYFKISFWAALGIATVIGISILLNLQMREGATGDGVFGPPFFIAIFACLAVATQILVPFSAFLSMGSEWDENTYDLLVLSNLRPRQIVWGKVLSASVQGLLFYSGFGPFLVFAFLLRGVDLLSILVALLVSFVASVLLACCAVAMSSFGRGRFARLQLMVLLAVLLVWVTMGTIMWASQMILFPGQLHDPDVLSAIGAALSISATLAAFFFAAACARLAHPEENRSSGLRWMTLASIAVGLAWLTYINGYRFNTEMIVASAIMGHVALAVTSIFFVTEPERLGRRVAVSLPRNGLLRMLAIPILPGGARGILFFLQGSALIALWMLAYSLVVKGRIVYSHKELDVLVALPLYGLIYLGIPSVLFSKRTNSLRIRMLARAPLLLAFTAGIMLPVLLAFLLGHSAGASFEQPLNVPIVIEHLWEGKSRIGGVWPFLIGAAGISLVLNLARISRAAAELSWLGAVRTPNKRRGDPW